MTQQQVKGGSIGASVARVAAGGPSTCLRGLSATCFREGIFAAAYLGLAPVLRAKLREAAPGANEEALRVPAALGGAAVCGILSHPFDTVKTCMQGDIERSVYGTTRQTVSAIWARGGAAALYRGIEFRFLRQAWQVWVLDLLRERLSPVLFPSSASLAPRAAGRRRPRRGSARRRWGAPRPPRAGGEPAQGGAVAARRPLCGGPAAGRARERGGGRCEGEGLQRKGTDG
ncbi:unnamed protein product [Prorocentrum cordatum]|uniref:Mitochondrial carrier protein n=1 Tax=Prorocentrum cordatum TaxID=2364126 RepID=A0ABN9S6Q5_9DINO|nr:unnamed protein product [Polarella glacialis]